MSFLSRPFSPNFATKNEQTVASTRLATSQNIGALSGPVQVRLINYDTSRVAITFGTKAVADAVTVANSPTVAAGSTEVITVHPNQDGSVVYWNIIGDGTPAGNKFEVTLGQGI